MTKARDLASGLNGVRPFAMAAGSTTTSASTGTVTVTFPANRFTQPPIVTASSISGGVWAIYTEIISTPSATSFNVAVNADGAAYPQLVARNLHWHAIQMTSGSANG